MYFSQTLKNQLHKILIQDEVEAISVVNPQNYEKNIKHFQNVLEENRVKYAIHSVLKVNHSNALLKTARKCGLRADVSSLGELEQALKAGFTGENITANGPKNTKFLRKCLEEDVTIVVDSIEEIEKLIQMSEWREKKIKILLRLSEFEAENDSRFGIPKIQWEQSVQILQNTHIFDVCGIHFHVASLDLENRKRIFWEAVSAYKMLVKWWFHPYIFNIGGSFWAYYQSDISLNDIVCTKTKNKKTMYPQNTLAWADFLEKFLNDISYRGSSIKQFLQENRLELWLEPWRSLTANHTGFIATSVIGRRFEGIILNTNSFGVGMREEELPINPVLLDFVGENPPQTHTHSSFIFGNLCLESDYIYARAIPFHREVVADDIIIFPDMASYHMDFHETESIFHPKKVRYFQDENDHLLLDT